jgi:hypothetical protein
VLEDGAAPNALSDVPDNARIELRMTQGSTLKVRLYLVNTAGTPLRLAADPTATVWMTIKAKANQDTPNLSVAGTILTAEGQNRVDFSIPAAATTYMVPGRYVYDVWLTFNNSRDPVVPLSPFILEPGLLLP